MLSAFAAWIKSIFEQIAFWFVELILLVFSWLWGGLLWLLDAIGLAEQIRASAALFDKIPDSVWYFMNMFEIQFGMGAILVAYCFRFLIRRIPVIG